MRADMKRGGSKSGLFLIELMIAILFFALASAVCMQLFARAHLLARQSRDLSVAVNKAQTAAEYFKTADESAAEAESEIFFDAQWNPVADGGVYSLKISREDGQPVVARITVRDIQRDKTIYSLQAGKYVPEG